MATRSEQIRRNKLAEEAKQRLQSGVYNQRPMETPVNPRTAALRAYRANLIEDKPVPELKSKLIQSGASPSFFNMAKDPIKDTLLGAAVNGDPRASKVYNQLTGVNVRQLQGPPVAKTQYEINQEDIAKSGAPGVVQGFSNAMNWLVEGNDVGRFINRPFNDIARSQGVNTGLQPTTGSPFFDKTADLLSIPLSAALPIAPGVAGVNLTSGPLKMAEGALSTKTGQALTNGLTSGLSKAGLSAGTASKVAQNIGIGAGAGAVGNTAYTAMSGHTSVGDLGKSAVEGLLIGAGLGGAGTLVGAGLSKLFKKNGIPDAEMADILALPEGRLDSRMNAAAQRSKTPYGSDPIVNPYTPELPQASPRTQALAKNVSEGNAELNKINSTLDELNTRYEQRIIDEYKYLKQSRDSRGGVEQGNIQRNPAGDVVGRTGRTSNNPLWYQKFYSENGRVPSNKDLYQLARDRVDNGFADEAGQVPAWVKDSGHADQVAAYTTARDNLQKGIKDINPSINVTSDPLVTQKLFDTRPKAPKKTQLTQDELDAELTKRKEDIYAKLKTERGEPLGSTQTYEDAWRLAEESMKNDPTPGAMEMPSFDPNAEPILRPSQFDDNNGLGISAFGKAKPYDSISSDTRSQLRSRLDREVPNLGAAGNKIYTAMVDDLHPMNQFDKYTEKVLGKSLEANESPYKMALGARGADMIAKQIVTNKLVDSTGKVVGESLKEVLSGLPKRSKHIYVDFEDYLLNKHAITRAARGEKVFRDSLKWTPEKGAQKVAEYERMFPEFKHTADKLYEFNKNLINSWLVEPGMITKQQAKAMFDANPYYIPNKRYFSNVEKGSRGISRLKNGFGNQSVPIKGYGKGGSQRQIISPIEAMIENVDAYVKAAKRNQVMQQLVKNIEQDPEAFSDFAEVIKKPDKPEDITKMLLDGDGLDEVLSRFGEDYSKLMQNSRLDLDNVVRVLVDGEVVHVRVSDKPLLEAITAMGPQHSGWLLDAVGYVTKKMKLLTTGANPVFSLTRNIQRDIPHAYISSKSTNNPIRFIADLADASVQILRDGELYQRYKSVGGGHSSSIASDRNLLAQSKRSVLPGNKLQGIVPKAFDKFENIMNAFETAPRLAEFKRVSKSGTPDALQKALFEAQDLTINFKRRGTLSKEIDKVFPYFNAAIQGLDQFARMYKNNPIKASVKAFMALTVPAVALYAKNYNDPNYQKLSNREKDNFLMIPKGDGTFYKVAKPRELGVLFTALPERLLRQFNEQDPTAFRGFAEQLRTAFFPPGVSGFLKPGADISDRVLGDTILGPMVNLASNKNFAGSPIVPGYLQNLSPALQSDAKTSSLANFVGEKTNYSPKKIDFLIKQYTGGIGQFGLPLLSPGGDVGSALNQQVTADPVFSNDISTEFYKYKGKLDQAYNDRDVKDLPSWYDDGLRTGLAKISKAMSSIRGDIRAVQADTTLSNTEKRSKLRELQDQINSYAEEGNKLARGVIPYE